MSLLVVGSIAFDTVETPYGRREEMLGGSATHFSCAARYFTDVNVVAVVGSDFPSDALDLLTSRGVNLDGLQVLEGKTFRWEARYHDEMSQAETLATHLNVFKDFAPTLPESYRASPFVFLANIDPDLQADVLRQVRSPRLVAADTMNHWIVEKKDAVAKLMASTDVAVLNDAEARMLTGEHNLCVAARRIQDLGTKHVVIKKGEHGALLFSENSILAIPALPLADVCDPTGAGDTFAGGFMGRIAQLGEVTEDALRESMLYGCVMASFNVQAFGVEGVADLTQQDIARRIEDFRNLIRV
jgi:sugar/nucleoside kinase (ribokinase family)